eukprot:scaffold8828_cov204-Amphora_coffeaeformis.AAC.19
MRNRTSCSLPGLTSSSSSSSSSSVTLILRLALLVVSVEAFQRVPLQATLQAQQLHQAQVKQQSQARTAMWKRRDWFTSSLVFLATLTGSSVAAFAVPSSSSSSSSASALPTTSTMFPTILNQDSQAPNNNDSSSSSSSSSSSNNNRDVLFQDLTFPLALDSTTTCNIPVACWWPSSSSTTTTSSSNSNSNSNNKPAVYAHRISVRRIGQLLARWDFIPSFASRDFVLPSSKGRVWQGQVQDHDWQGPVVVLAHGYLGSRFDLSHLAETLAAELGVLCIAPEYPESLASSYERVPGLDRATINQQLLNHVLPDVWNIHGTRFGIVGHSLGTGTALTTGDESWARVLLAGFPRQRDGSAIVGNLLLICSLNDGAMSLNRFGGRAAIPSDFELVLDSVATDTENAPLPRRAAWILDAPDAPNHISFLSAGVNDAMIDLLSPLLPVAQWANIPVLDFDKYQTSRDAELTAKLLHPVIVRYLKQEMNIA